ncbi:MAG: DUF4974 domain-containing protein [Marinilabiliaceae bacterium]|nr:DUF4974 domain-containing protein [Marinilabiliaceae bacterium]
MDSFRNLIEKYRKGKTLSNDEQQSLYQLAEHGNDGGDFKEVLSDRWNEICNEEVSEQNELDDLYYKVFYKVKSTMPGKKSGAFSLLTLFNRVAAILLIPLLVVSGLYLKEINSQPQLVEDVIEIESPLNTKTHFFLPDGSSGWLKAGSRLVYHTGNATVRKARLEGGAFFEVAKNEDAPFVVSTQDFKVRVLGTKFNVTCYSDDEHSKVFLQEGKVEMLDNNDQHQTILKPGQQYLYKRDAQTFSVEDADVEEQLAWTKGILILRNRPLSEVAEELEQFYNIEVEIKDKALETIPVYAEIQNERLDDVMEYLKLIISVKYKIEESHKQKDGSFTKRKVMIYQIE